MMRVRVIVVLAMLLLSSAYAQITHVKPLADVEEAFAYKNSNTVADVPEWRVNDQWIYSGSFDPQGLISQGNVNANVGTITGDSTNTVTEILTMAIENQSTLVYKVRVTASFDKSGVSLDGYNGDLEIDYSATELWRASDLSLIKRDLGLAVDFEAFGFIHIDVADVTISTSHAPPNEGYDFPLRTGERWISNSTTSVAWSGSSDYISPFPEDTSSQSTDYFEITGFGNPINAQGQGISYSGCGDSFEITSYDSNGLKDGYNWYCPAARSYAWMHTEDSIGLTIDFRLKSYSPTASSGVNSNSDPGQRNTNVNVELKNEITALNATQEAWVNVTDSSGSPLSGEPIELRHEIEGITKTGTTAANGSAWFEFSAGDSLDPSPTTYDWASHGIIARLGSTGSIMGATTMTLDDNLVGLDLVAMTDRVSIERNRSGEVRPLNDISGYNVLPGDNLTFELPVMNRGVIASSPTTVVVQQPDGQTNSFNVPSLSTYEEFRVGLSWTVPSDSTIGNVAISYEVDPTLINSLDANPSNNLGQIFVFVGTLPEIVIEQFEPVLSMSNFELIADQSFDLDGGGVSCLFDFEYESNEEIEWGSIDSTQCSVVLSWIDDGTFEVIITVIDEEQDTATTSVNVTVLNRPATVVISSQLNEVPALSMITMDVFANDTDSEDDWPGLVDVFWPEANCLEGYFTRTCTTTSDVEGVRSFTAVGTDDDGEYTYTSWNVTFTNAIPQDVNVSLWDEDGQSVEANAQGTFVVNEDDTYWLRAVAVDSQDDLTTLEWRWRPDDQNTSWFERTEGDSTAIEVAWTRSGRNIVRLEVVDNDGASSGFIETWVEVENVHPHIDELPTTLPIAEAQTIQLTGTYYDTVSDNDTIIACWDIDTGINQDGIGHASDDCDAFGDTLSWSWEQSGVHQVVFHVVDDDGARSSKTTNITVLNQPPRPTIVTCQSTSAGRTCELTVSRVLDSTDDLPYLTYTWDTDASIDSDGDGDASNDADLVGRTVNQTWELAGSYKVTVRVLDEDVSRPGYATTTVEVSSSQGGLVGDAIASVLGDDASLITQFLALVLFGLIGLVTFRTLRSKTDEEKVIAPWDEESTQLGVENQLPQMVDLTQDKPTEHVSTDEIPDGWTKEQWEYYGKNDGNQISNQNIPQLGDELDI